jgi:hypothetical protein
MRVRIYLEDEAPRIGCGWRTVDVKLGRKWAYLTEVSSGIRTRLPLGEAEQIIEGSFKWKTKKGTKN